MDVLTEVLSVKVSKLREVLTVYVMTEDKSVVELEVSYKQLLTLLCIVENFAELQECINAL